MPDFNPNPDAFPLKRFPFPWRAVHLPVVPAVFDNSLSLLEVCQKLLNWLNQTIEQMNALHADIVALKEYVDTQDAATLAAANAYAVALRDALKEYVDAQDAATLASANAYTDTQDTATLALAKAYADGLRDALKQYVDTQDAATLAAAKTYADGLNTAVRAYIDAQLALKQDLLTFDFEPTENSSNPVTSDGIKAALDVAYGRMPQCAPLIIDTDAMTVSTVGVFSFDKLYAKMHTLHSFYVLEITDTASTSAMREAHAFAYPETYSASIIHWTLNDATPNNETLRISVTNSNVWTVTLV